MVESWRFGNLWFLGGTPNFAKHHTTLKTIYTLENEHDNGTSSIWRCISYQNMVIFHCQINVHETLWLEDGFTLVLKWILFQGRHSLIFRWFFGGFKSTWATAPHRTATNGSQNSGRSLSKLVCLFFLFPLLGVMGVRCVFEHVCWFVCLLTSSNTTFLYLSKTSPRMQSWPRDCKAQKISKEQS